MLRMDLVFLSSPFWGERGGDLFSRFSFKDSEDLCTRPFDPNVAFRWIGVFPYLCFSCFSSISSSSTFGCRWHCGSPVRLTYPDRPTLRLVGRRIESFYCSPETFEVRVRRRSELFGGEDANKQSIELFGTKSFLGDFAASSTLGGPSVVIPPPPPSSS